MIIARLLIENAVVEVRARCRDRQLESLAFVAHVGRKIDPAILRRNGIGIELDEAHYRTATARLTESTIVRRAA